MHLKINKMLNWLLIVILLLGILISLLPVPVKSYSQVLAVSGPYNPSFLAIAPNGDLVAWGENSGHTLGNGVDLYHSYLFRRTVLRNADSVCATSRTAMAIDTDGVLWVWGLSKLMPEIDVGINPNTPVRIMENVIAVGVGEYHGAAIRSDGSLWTWGRNWHGELGIGSTGEEGYLSPNLVLDNVQSIFLWENNTFAVRSNGDLYAWGEMAGVASPMRIASEIVCVSSCNDGLQCLKSDGTVWIWNGPQVGFSSTPVVNQIRTLIPNGVLKTDDSMWIWTVKNGERVLEKRADQIACAAGEGFYLTKSGRIYATDGDSNSFVIPHGIFTLSPILRNLFLVAFCIRLALYLVQECHPKFH